MRFSMEAKQYRCIKILGLLFVLATIFHVFYASCSQRALYLDGSFFMTLFLDRIANRDFSLLTISEHPRQMVLNLTNFPVMAAGFLFKNVTDKSFFSMIYSFAWFGLPVLGLFWNYKLTQRTKQYAILFLSIFTYGAIILLYQIFALVETGIGVPLQFVLLNYLTGKIDYTKWDKIGIGFILVMMFGIYEHTILIGILLFMIMFTCLYDEENPHNLLTKIIIGAGSLGASFYTIFFVIMSKSEHEDGKRFLKEMVDFFPLWNKLCILISIVTVVLLVAILIYKKNKPLSNKAIALFSGLYIYLFFYMLSYHYDFINPVYEQHSRGLIMWAVPLMFLGIFVSRIKKFPECKALIEKLYVPVLLCAITTTAWQVVTTYFWNENVSYLINEVKKCEGPLYMPSYEEDKEISSFWNQYGRRFIWNANIVTTALVVIPDYNVKSLVMHYNTERDKSNPTLRAMQFVNTEKGLIGMPYYCAVKIKNKFWDLTKPAKALDKYNKEHSVQTMENEFQ